MADNKTDIERRISRDQLSAIQSFDEAVALVESTYGSILDASQEFGDGFELLKDKNSLIGIPFLIVDFQMAAGEFDDEFVVARVVTADNRKLVITDGSTGIRDQLRSLTTKAGIVCKRGLTRSDYEFTDADGKTRPATTFYLA